MKYKASLKFSKIWCHYIFVNRFCTIHNLAFLIGPNNILHFFVIYLTIKFLFHKNLLLNLPYKPCSRLEDRAFATQALDDLVDALDSAVLGLGADVVYGYLL